MNEQTSIQITPDLDNDNGPLTLPPSPDSPAKAGRSGPGWNLDIEPWPEPVDGKLLLDELVRLFASFVILRTETYYWRMPQRELRKPSPPAFRLDCLADVSTFVFGVQPQRKSKKH